MDASALEQYLRQGLSLEKIGELTGRHPSTVGYWVKQHGYPRCTAIDMHPRAA
jgi:transposase-like protein